MRDRELSNKLFERIATCECNRNRGRPTCQQCKQDEKLLAIVNTNIRNQENQISLLFIVCLTSLLLFAFILLAKFL